MNTMFVVIDQGWEDTDILYLSADQEKAIEKAKKLPANNNSTRMVVELGVDTEIEDNGVENCVWP